MRKDKYNNSSSLSYYVFRRVSSSRVSSPNFDMEMELLFPQRKEFREETENTNRGVFISVLLEAGVVGFSLQHQTLWCLVFVCASHISFDSYQNDLTHFASPLERKTLREYFILTRCEVQRPVSDEVIDS